MQFDFEPVAKASKATLVQTVTSQGGRYVRCTAMRGTLATSRLLPATGLELAQARIRVQLNGQIDLIGGTGGINDVSMGLLFEDITSPWLWWQSPILLRAGDRIAVTIVNTTSGEVAPTFFPTVAFRIIDDDLWQELYTRDWRQEP